MSGLTSIRNREPKGRIPLKKQAGTSAKASC
jgi:hypothetical protein